MSEGKYYIIKRATRTIVEIPAQVLLLLINIYQKTLSPDHGPLSSLFPHGYCRYSPSCSEYGKIAIQKRGAVVGVVLATWRVLRCNPWSKGGHDEIN